MKLFILLTVLFASSALAEIIVPRHVFVPTTDEVASPEGRITNGKTAATGQFPYQVGLKLSLGSFSSSWCGGSLISNQWVLTAAHCVDGVKSATVYLGATIRSKPEKTISVSKSGLIAHAKYNSRTIQNDIALIKLPQPVQLTSKIQTIELATANSDVYAGENAIVSGWGLESDASSGVASSLNYAILKIASSTTCVRVFTRSSFTSKNICASTTGYTSTCQGDSGGPLVAMDDNCQIGIVSYGSSKGCEAGYPVAFTKVSSYIDWINDQTGLDFLKPHMAKIKFE